MYFDILVTVTASVFVVETQSMEQFVLDYAIIYAAKPLQRHQLLLSNTTQQRVTARKGGDKQDVHQTYEFKVFPLFLRTITKKKTELSCSFL